MPSSKKRKSFYSNGGSTLHSYFANGNSIAISGAQSSPSKTWKKPKLERSPSVPAPEGKENLHRGSWAKGTREQPIDLLDDEEEEVVKAVFDEVLVKEDIPIKKEPDSLKVVVELIDCDAEDVTPDILPERTWDDQIPQAECTPPPILDPDPPTTSGEEKLISPASPEGDTEEIIFGEDEWEMGDDELVPDEGGVEFEGDDDVEEIGDFEQDAADVDSESQDGAAARTSGCPICGAIIEDLAKLQLHVNACLDTPPVASSSFPPAPKTRYQPKQKPISARSPSPLKPLPIDPSYTLPSPSSTLAPPPRGNPSAFSVLMSQNKDHLAWAAAEQHEVRGPRSGAGRRKAPFYKVMQGMPIAVDAFRYGKIPGVTAYCLTHAHSDHYTNLSSSWKHGPIYCSSTTANLIKLNLSVAPEYVHPLPLNTPTTLPNTGGVQVILLEANHCPGSVLFLFIGRQTVNAGDSPISSPFVGSQRTFRYLHCGDFRACPAHALHPEIKGKKLDLVYLDTTYLNPRYCFPPQRQVVDACASLAKRMVLGTEEEKEDKPKGVTQSVLRGWFKAEPKEEAVEPGLEIEEELALDPEEELDVTFNGDLPPPLPPPPKPLPAPHPTSAAEESKPSTPGKTLVAIGTYSIGKERIVKAIALALGSKIYCDARKRGLLLAQDDPELHSLLTTDPYSCQVHLLPLQSITVDRMQDYLEQFKGLFDRVLGFRPTGWTYVPPAGMDVMPDVSRVIVRDQKRVFDETALKPTRAASQKYMLYGVPYSEHSSFFELTCFALSVDVGKIIATVNVHSASSRGKMQKWFEKWDVERKRRRNAGHEVVQYRTVDYW